MMLPQIVKNLYINSKTDWIKELDDTMIEPFVINIWLSMNDKIRMQVRWLDKYVFKIPKKMWLTLAWSVIPKQKKQPWVKFIKKKIDEEEYEFILNKIIKHMNLSDNDYESIKYRLIKYIMENKVDWFTYYGIEKKHWKQHYLSFEEMRKDKKNKSLNDFFGGLK